MPSQPFSSCGQGIDLKPFHAPSTFRCDPPRKLVLVHPQHEASVSQVSEEMLFYMQQRGISEAQAMSLAVNGFINDLVREFPMEYSVELKRLIDLEMEGSVG